jgi:NAD(P)-dependent dehydrogenase (short-subunit alcohol dehydrogenase family)
MKTALITGGAQRIGAQITKTLHAHGYNIAIIVVVLRNSAKREILLLRPKLRIYLAFVLLGNVCKC